jgi:PhoPQ-activated pathogenicity-related protein
MNAVGALQLGATTEKKNVREWTNKVLWCARNVNKRFFGRKRTGVTRIPRTKDNCQRTASDVKTQRPSQSTTQPT